MHDIRQTIAAWHSAGMPPREISIASGIPMRDLHHYLPWKGPEGVTIKHKGITLYDVVCLLEQRHHGKILKVVIDGEAIPVRSVTVGPAGHIGLEI